MLQVWGRIGEPVDEPHETPEVSKVGGGWKFGNRLDKFWILPRALFVYAEPGEQYLLSQLILVLRQRDPPLLTAFKDLSDTTEEFIVSPPIDQDVVDEFVDTRNARQRLIRSVDTSPIGARLYQ